MVVEEQSQLVSPDLGARYVQLQMHQVPVAGFVESAVDGDRGQERVLGIEGPRIHEKGRNNKWRVGSQGLIWSKYYNSSKY